MSATPETIITALLALINAQLSGTFKTIAQKQPPFDQMNQQPALIAQHVGDDDIWSGDGLQRTVLRVELWVWIQTKNPDGTPSSDLRSVTTPIRAALAPADIEERQTLGGIVYNCRIEGQSHYFPSDLGDQGLAIIPVSIELNSTYP